MKSNKSTAILTALITMISASILFAQDYQKITGTYTNPGADCQCNSLGFLSYTKSNGEQSRMYLCFDSEPGSFYEIYDNEQITVEGTVKGMSCGNDGKTFWTMYVHKSVLPMRNRLELVPEFIKKQNTSLPNTTQNQSEERLSAGKYSQVQREYLPPSDCSDSKARGVFNYFKWKEGVKSGAWVTINACAMFSANGYPPSNVEVVLYGSWNGDEFVISRWEYAQSNDFEQKPIQQKYYGN